MSAMIPNSPVGRFEHVIKTYWGKSYKGESLNAAVLDTLYVTVSLVGAHDAVGHRPSNIIAHEPGSLTVLCRAEEMMVERTQKLLDLPPGRVSNEPGAIGEYRTNMQKWAAAARAMLARLGQPYEYDAQGFIDWDGEQWGLADLTLAAVRLPEHNRYDFLIPWIGRELVKLLKAVIDLAMVEFSETALRARKDYRDAVHLLHDKAPAIAQWAKETRTDIGKVDLATALEAVSIYQFKTSLVEQGDIVYTFKDGWTVQELRTESALTAEGNNMQNCIAGYHDAVEEGGTRIYSIRDKAGNPHVSMELRGVAPVKGARIRGTPMSLIIGPPGADLGPDEFIRSPLRMGWYFAQILGKQNDRPIDAYRERAREFIDKIFDKEGFGWCIVGGTAKWARFSGRQLSNLDVPAILGPNHVQNDVLAGADFAESRLEWTNLSHLDLTGCVFDRANTTRASFRGASLEGAKFEGATCDHTDFAGARLVGTSFDSADCTGSDFQKAQLAEALFRDARVDGADFHLASGGQRAVWEGANLTIAQTRQLEELGHVTHEFLVMRRGE